MEFVEDKVNGSEHFSRWVYCPRFIDVDGNINSNFIKLRPHINEQGISGQLFDRISLEISVNEGTQFIRKNKQGLPIEKLVAIAVAEVAEIVNLAQLPDVIKVESVPSNAVSAHAEIRFYLDGVMATGNSYSHMLQFYFELIKDLMANHLLKL